VIDFAIIAFVIFVLVKVMNKLQGAVAAPEPTKALCPECLMEVPIHAKKCGHCSSVIEGKV